MSSMLRSRAGIAVIMLIVVAALALSAYKPVCGRIKAAKVARLQKEFDNLNVGDGQTRLIDRNLVKWYCRNLAENNLELPNFYGWNRSVVDILDNDESDEELESGFWQEGGSSLVQDCRNAKFVATKTGIALSGTKRFDGGNAFSWVALVLSRQDPQIIDKRYRVWNTKKAIENAISDAERVPAYYLAHPKEYTGQSTEKLDLATLNLLLPDSLDGRFIDREAVWTDEDLEIDINHRLDANAKRRKELQAEIKGTQAILVDLRLTGWEQDYVAAQREAERKGYFVDSAVGFQTRWEQKIAGAKTVIHDDQQLLRQFPTRERLWAQARESREQAKAHQALLDKVRAAVKTRLYARAK